MKTKDKNSDEEDKSTEPFIPPPTPDLQKDLNITIPDTLSNDLHTLIFHDTSDLKQKDPQLFMFRNNERPDNRSYLDGASLISFSVDKMSITPKRVPPPKLNLSPINSDYSDTIEDINDMHTQDLYDLFYKKHMNEITTPEEADRFVYEFKKKKNSLLK